MAATASAANLDFTDVKDGGASFNKKRVPMGDYLAKITSVVDAPTKAKDGRKGGEPQWLYTIELVEKYTDRKFPYYCKLEANQLWKVRNLFLAAGKAIPKKRVKLNPNLIVGKLIGITLEDDEFDGKLQSNIVQTFSAADLDGGDTDSDDEEEDGEELDDEEEEEPAPPARRTRKPAPAPEPEEEDEEEAEEDEEEEDEPAPQAKIPAQRRSSPAAKKAAPARRKPAATVDVDDDELEELDITEI